MRTFFQQSRAQGAAMLAVMALAIVGGIAITAWTYLLAARAIQSDRMSDATARHLTQRNTLAINQQYVFGYAFQDTISEPQLTTFALTDKTSVSSISSGQTPIGGEVAQAYTNLSAFASAYTYSNPASYAAPFNNLRYIPTADHSVYYTRTTAVSDDSQTEHLLYYNYQKSYPRTLLGDLFIVHSKPTGASGAPFFTDNIQVNGRVLVYDSTADVSGVGASECLNLTKNGTNGCLNLAGTASLLPSNLPARALTTAGTAGSGTGAVLGGALNVLNNTNFTVNSLNTKMAASSLGYYILSTANTSSTPLSSGSNVESDDSGGVTGTATNGGSSSSDIWVKKGNPPSNAFTPPTTSPYNYTWPNSPDGTTVTLLLKSSTLKHIKISSGVTQLILQGQTNAADYTSAATVEPLIILVEQEIRDIRFVGECSRPIILGVGTGTGVPLFMSWSGSSTASGGGPLRWTLSLINQYRELYLDPPSGNNVSITGSIRTNWSIRTTDTSSTDRFFLYTNSSPGTLVNLLPRDAWFEPLIIQ